MLTSTYAALRTQGLSAKPLMRAAAMNYGNGTGRKIIFRMVSRIGSGARWPARDGHFVRRPGSISKR